MYPILVLQHLISPKKFILAFVPWALVQLHLGMQMMLRCQMAFEIGFSREGPLVVAGSDNAIKFQRRSLWLAAGLRSQRGSDLALLGKYFNAAADGCESWR